MAQQTAVEWLMSQMLKPDMYKIWPTLLERAKAIEKKQIINAHIEGQRVFDKHPHTQYTNDQAELYYNETYEK